MFVLMVNALPKTFENDQSTLNNKHLLTTEGHSDSIQQRRSITLKRPTSSCFSVICVPFSHSSASVKIWALFHAMSLFLNIVSL